MGRDPAPRRLVATGRAGRRLRRRARRLDPGADPARIRLRASRRCARAHAADAPHRPPRRRLDRPALAGGHRQQRLCRGVLRAPKRRTNREWYDHDGNRPRASRRADDRRPGRSEQSECSVRGAARHRHTPPERCPAPRFRPGRRGCSPGSATRSERVPRHRNPCPSGTGRGARGGWLRSRSRRLAEHRPPGRAKLRADAQTENQDALQLGRPDAPGGREPPRLPVPRAHDAAVSRSPRASSSRSSTSETSPPSASPSGGRSSLLRPSATATSCRTPPGAASSGAS